MPQSACVVIQQLNKDIPPETAQPLADVRPRGEDEQPGTVPGRNAGRSQRLVQRRQGLRGQAGQHAALCQRPVQVHEQVGHGGMLQRMVRHLLGPCPVTEAVKGIGEPTGQPAVLGRVSCGAGNCLSEKFCRDPGRLADQRVCGAGQPVQHPLIHWLRYATWPSHRLQQAAVPPGPSARPLPRARALTGLDDIRSFVNESRYWPGSATVRTCRRYPGAAGTSGPVTVTSGAPASGGPVRPAVSRASAR